jgi:hypothetical protein
MTDAAAAAPAPKKRGIFKKILLGFLAVIVIFLVVVACQPADFRVTRTATMTAPSAAAFAQVNDLHRWEAWNPWGKLDPAMKQTYSGSPTGTGSVYDWSGNDQAGQGRITIVDSRPNELVKIKLEFMKPMEGTNDVQFLFKTEGDKTSVTWDMAGRKNFISKGVCMFMDMDKMVGGEFEKGLAGIKAIVEKK